MKNLLESWDSLIEQWVNKRIILFLDYDGTLSPIADQPFQAVLPPENKELIEQLVQNPRFQVVILSGRKLSDVKEMVDIEGVIYIGNHGWEIEGSSMHFESLVPLHVSAMMEKIKYELITQLCGIPGVFVEDKGVTLSVHYRLVPQDKEFLVKRIFDYVSMPYRRKNELKAQAGKKSAGVKTSDSMGQGQSCIMAFEKAGNSSW